MNSKITKIGILGKANIAIKAVIPAFLDLNDKFEIAGIATRSILQDDNLPFNNIKMLEGYGNIIDNKIIDALYIPLPNSLHYTYIKDALSKGIHVLVEKSLVCSLEEAIELNEIAKKNELVLLENFQFRKHSQLEYVQNILRGNILGELRFIRSTFCFPPFRDKNNIRYKKELGGGALLDAGAYPVKISQLLLGEDLFVTAANLYRDEKLGVDIYGGAQLEDRNSDVISQIAFGFDNYYQCNVEIIGTKGKLSTNRIFTAHKDVIPVMRLETSEGAQDIELPKDDHFKKMLQYFYKLINAQDLREKEYSGNINQARLLNEIKIIINEK